MITHQTNSHKHAVFEFYFNQELSFRIVKLCQKKCYSNNILVFLIYNGISSNTYFFRPEYTHIIIYFFSKVNTVAGGGDAFLIKTFSIFITMHGFAFLNISRIHLNPFLFKNISSLRKYYYDQRPIGYPSEIVMSDRRP